MSNGLEPRLRYAVICERVLHETDGVPSLIRIVDRFDVNVAGRFTPEAMPPAVMDGVLAVSFTAGLGDHLFESRFTGPGELNQSSGLLSFHLSSLEQAHNLNAQFSFEFRLPGIYWVSILLNGKEVTRLPLRVAYHRQEMPAGPMAGR